MIWATDAVVLAYTKLRTRRFRHVVVILTSSLLFIAISTVLFLVRGTIGSIEGYLDSGLASRYIISARSFQLVDVYTNKDVINRAKEIQKEYIKDKVAESKRLNLSYDQNSEPLVATSFNDGEKNNEMLNDLFYYPVSQAIKEYYDAKNFNYKDKLKNLSEGYDLADIYEQKLIRGDQQNLYLQIMLDGKESYDDADGIDKYSLDNLESFSQNYSLISSELLQPFVLPGENLEIGEDGTLPVLVPYSAAQKLLKLKELEKNADSKRKSEYLKELRNKALGYKFDVCFRNTTSSQALVNAKIESQDYNKNKDKKDYIKPDYIRDLPKENCGAVSVLRDVRSKEQKDRDNNQIAFDQKFGTEPERQSVIKYRIVGVLPNIENSASSLQQLLQTVLTSSMGSGWVSPLEVASINPILGVLASNENINADGQYFAEFKNVDSAKKFMNEKNCISDFNVVSTSTATSNPYQKCADEGKYFTLSPFGANSIAISEFKTRFYGFFNYVILYLGIFAAIILLGVVSRVIADSRRETAVFRAIGAKRLDIAQIYLTYVIMIGMIVSLVSIFIAILIGQLIQNRYATDLNLVTSVTFNSTGVDQAVFKIYEVVPRDLLIIMGTVFFACILSALIPIVTNVRRNPISDMRDER